MILKIVVEWKLNYQKLKEYYFVVAITTFTGGQYQLSDGEPFYWFIMYNISIYFFNCTFTSSKRKWNTFENYNQICEKKSKWSIYTRDIHVVIHMPCYFKPGGVSCLNRSCFRFGFGIIALHTNVTYMYVMNRQLLPLNVRFSWGQFIFWKTLAIFVHCLFNFYILFLFCIQTFTVVCMFQFFCKNGYVK